MLPTITLGGEKKELKKERQKKEGEKQSIVLSGVVDDQLNITLPKIFVLPTITHGGEKTNKINPR